MHKSIIIFFCIVLLKAQAIDTDSVDHHEVNIYKYDQTKIVVSDGVNSYESWEEYRGYIMMRDRFSYSRWHIDWVWEALQAETFLTEQEFFMATGYPDKADKVRSYRSKIRVMKWSSPFLIIGGVLMSGISSDWGRENRTSALTLTGLGISLTGIIVGIEGISKSKKKKHDMHEAIKTVDIYNQALKQELGLIDTVEQEKDRIKAYIDSTGIEVVPYYMLDEKPQPLFDQESQPGYIQFPESLKAVVKALINTSGNVAVCQILETSGITSFDDMLLKQSIQRKYTPAIYHGEPVYTIITMPYRFEVK
jgi:hypothetical protein